MTLYSEVAALELWQWGNWSSSRASGVREFDLQTFLWKLSVLLSWFKEPLSHSMPSGSMCLSLCGLVFLGEGGCDLLRSGLSRSVPGPVLSLSLDHTAVGRRFSCTSSQHQLYVHPWCIIPAFIMPSLVLWASGRCGRASPSDLGPRWTPVTPSGTRLFPWHHGDSLCKQSPYFSNLCPHRHHQGHAEPSEFLPETMEAARSQESWPRHICLDNLALQHLSLLLPVPWCCMHVTCTLVSTQRHWWEM